MSSFNRWFDGRPERVQMAVAVFLPILLVGSFFTFLVWLSSQGFRL